MKVSPKVSERSVVNRGLLAILVLVLVACSLDPGSPPTVALPEAVESGAAYTDAAEVMRGICFESAYGAALDEAVFVLRSDADLQRLFDLADNSGLCRRAVERGSFDFSDGRVLVGTWSFGMGCTANHDITTYTRDAAAQTVTLVLAFSTQGDCPYELVRPFWIAIPDAADYAITLTVRYG